MMNRCDGCQQKVPEGLTYICHRTATSAARYRDSAHENQCYAVYRKAQFHAPANQRSQAGGAYAPAWPLLTSLTTFCAPSHMLWANTSGLLQLARISLAISSRVPVRRMTIGTRRGSLS